MQRSVTLGSIFFALVAIACNNDDKKDTASSTSSGSGYWAVGEDASMIRLDEVGDVWVYPLDVEGDLRGIACKGKEAAVAVGDEGTILRTEDAGATWAQIDAGTRATLHGVALSAGTDAFAVGEDVVLRSRDLGRTWEAVPDAEGAWRAVATTAAGTTAWLASASGELWRLRGDELVPAYATGEGALAGVAASPDGARIVAVGEAGLLVRSDDSGASWRAEPTPTARDLHAVELAEDLIVAVGEAGVVLRLDGAGARATEHLDAALSLRALHLGAEGHAHAVGDHGVSLASRDGGRTWTAAELGLDVALLSLDDLDGEPHL